MTLDRWTSGKDDRHDTGKSDGIGCQLIISCKTCAASVQLYISFPQLPSACIMFSSSVGKAFKIVDELVPDVFVAVSHEVLDFSLVCVW